MTWVRLDEDFAQHPKVVAAGPLALAMQVAGLCYCNKHLTDGFIPWSAARSLVPWEFLGPRDEKDRPIYRVCVTSGHSGDDVTSDFVIGVLTDAAMWEKVEGGYRIHDFLDYNPSKAEVLAARESKKEAGRLGGKRSAEAKHSIKQTASTAPSTPEAEAPAKLKPVPVPVPVPGSVPVPASDSDPQGEEERRSNPPPSAPGSTNDEHKTKAGRVLGFIDPTKPANGLDNPGRIRRWFYLLWPEKRGNGAACPQEPEKDDAVARRLLKHHHDNKLVMIWEDFAAAAVEKYLEQEDEFLAREGYPMRLMNTKFQVIVAAIGAK